MAQFGTAQQTAFKNAVANQTPGTVCGNATVTRACTASDITLSMTPLPAQVSVDVASTILLATNTSMTTVDTALDGYMTSAQFASDLNDAGVPVASTCVGPCPAPDSSSSSKLGLILAIVAACVVGIGLLITAVCANASAHWCSLEEREEEEEKKEAAADEDATKDEATDVGAIIVVEELAQAEKNTVVPLQLLGPQTGPTLPTLPRACCAPECATPVLEHDDNVHDDNVQVEDTVAPLQVPDIQLQIDESPPLPGRDVDPDSV